jgi:hypothetical protein
MDHIRERVISISLDETEWQAFVALHPQPVTWLRERIKESIGADAPAISSSPRQAPAAASTTSATRQ